MGKLFAKPYWKELTPLVKSQIECHSVSSGTVTTRQTIVMLVMWKSWRISVWGVVIIIFHVYRNAWQNRLNSLFGLPVAGEELEEAGYIASAFRVGEAEAERASNVFCSSRDPWCWNSDTHIQGGLPTSTEPAWKHSLGNTLTDISRGFPLPWLKIPEAGKISHDRYISKRIGTKHLYTKPVSSS